MKRFLAGTLLLCILLSSCSDPKTAESAPESNSIIENESSGALTVEDNTMLTDEKIYERFSALNKEALPILLWYMELADSAEDLNIAEETDYAPYYEVGKFSTIDEMKAETDAVFTNTFTNEYFYDHAFTGDTPMYKEMDGHLYRNTDMGGMGWPFQAADEYYVAYQDENKIVIAVKSFLMDDKFWQNFLLRKENNIWKLDTYFDLNPYMEYADTFPRQRIDLISNAASSWFCSQDWTDANQLEPNALINFYLYTYLSDIKEEYDYEKGYQVSSKDLMDGLSVHLKDVKLETLTAINESAGGNARYDEETDSFYFDITFDPASYIVIDSVTDQNITTLEVMVIGKSGKAVYTSFLELEVNGSDVKLIGNKIGENFRV